ncbi:MAG: LysE family transporter [Thaumarchaeota archaeon]|nr:LysE family transporter [Nitrososphaerota archaeon]
MLPGWQVYFSGVLLGLTIAAPPGPVNATSASEARRSWFSGWLVLLGAATADGLFFLLTYYGITAFVASQQIHELLLLMGSALLIYLAFITLRSTGGPGKSPNRTGRYPYLLGLVIGLTNPIQLAWWLTVGVGMVSAFGLGIVFGFFSGIIAWTIAFTEVLHVSIARYESAYSTIAYVSGLVLLGFGGWFLYSAISGLL